MNGLYMVIISALILVICYRFYGAFIAAKVLDVYKRQLSYDPPLSKLNAVLFLSAYIFLPYKYNSFTKIQQLSYNKNQ